MKKEPFYNESTRQPYELLTKTEVDRLIAATKGAGRREDERDSVLMQVLSLGLGIHDTLSLTPSCVMLLPGGNGVIDIETEGGKLKAISCPGDLTDRLAAYARQKGLVPSEPFFRISRRQVQNIVRAAGHRAALGSITPSLLSQSGRRIAAGQDVPQCLFCQFRLSSKTSPKVFCAVVPPSEQN